MVVNGMLNSHSEEKLLQPKLEVSITVFGAFLAVSLAMFSALWFLWTGKKSRKGIAQLPPGPRGLPVVGYIPFLGVNMHEKFTELAGVYGGIYKLWLGAKLCVVVSSPSLAKEIVRDKDIIFSGREPPIAGRVFSYGGNDIVWSPYGPDWKKLRKVFVREMMSNASLDDFYALRRREVKKTIRVLYNKTGNPIDIGELAFLTTINAIMSMLWGGTLEGEEGTKAGIEFRKLIAELVVLVGKPNISDLFPVLAGLDLQGIERRTKKISGRFDNFINSIIEKCSSTIHANKLPLGVDDKRKDFLQLLLELKEKDQDPATSITMTQLKALLLDIVIGGSDTTSTMVEWTVAELMNHEDKMEKVLQELDEVVGRSNAVEEFHLPKLRYLDAVLKEALRLHPAVPLLVPRSPSTSSTLGEYTIPKGSTVFLNAYAMHRDPQLWENPLEFQPERFLNAEGTRKFDFSGNNFQYLPFGSGRRICAGLPLAEKMLMYNLASLLHSFEWKLPNDRELELSDRFGIVTKKMKPLIVIPAPRLSDSLLYE